MDDAVDEHATSRVEPDESGPPAATHESTAVLGCGRGRGHGRNNGSGSGSELGFLPLGFHLDSIFGFYLGGFYKVPLGFDVSSTWV